MNIQRVSIRTLDPHGRGARITLDGGDYWDYGYDAMDPEGKVVRRIDFEMVNLVGDPQSSDKGVSQKLLFEWALE